MTCPQCNFRAEPGATYCSRCGLLFNPQIDMSEFVRIAVLQSTKDEIFQWFAGWATILGAFGGGIGLMLVVVGVFGFNELVTNRVSQKVEERINEIKADIKSRKDELDMAIKKANSAKSELEIETGTLNAEVQTLREQRDKLGEEVNALRGERDKIASILKETSFVVALHKLRHELYQIRHLEMRSIIVLAKDNYEWINRNRGETDFSITLASSAAPPNFRLSKFYGDKTIQFTGERSPTSIVKTDSIELVSRNFLFEAFVDRFIGKSIDDLNGFNIISFHSSEINEIRKGATDVPAYKDSIDQEHWTPELHGGLLVKLTVSLQLRLACSRLSCRSDGAIAQQL